MASRFARLGHVALFVCLVLAMTIGATPVAAAQASRRGSLQVTVVDQSGAVIGNATVTVVGAEEATKAPGLAPVQTNAQGIASLAGLPPGRYTVRAEFPGFEPRTLPEVRVRAGDNKQVMMLPIAGVQDSVTVERNKQEAAADRQSTFGTVLTREQLEALSDDPDTLRQQLQDMAGPGAVIKVDSFEGAALPPKAMIRSIRISRDQFAAENHSAGGISVEIITQPGLGPIRYNTGFRFRGGSLSGRSPFTPTRGPEQTKNYMVGINGTLVPQKSSFQLNVEGLNSFETPNINASTGTGTRSEALRLRTPRDNMRVNANVDYALTLDQTLRFGYNGNRTTVDNLGIGAYDFEERAYSTENSNHNLRMQHMGPLGRRMFMRTRLQVTWTDSQSRSAIEAPTIRVLDAFTRGGAQLAGGQHNRSVTAATDLDYVRGTHSFRTGIELFAQRVRADDTSNYLGTYTFESQQAYDEGRPRSYTRRVGDADIRYNNLQSGLYLQDDIRLRRNLTLSPGVRYEAQTHVGDYDGVMPRVGVTWAPFKSGVTTLRSSWGVFHDWLPASTYEQTLRVDGFRQREIDLEYPGYPDVGEVLAPPANRYLLGSGLSLPRTSRMSVGVDQRIGRVFQSTATYAYQRGVSVFRGLNLNAPGDGIRPDVAFGNIIEVVSDGKSRQHQAQVGLNMNPGALLPAFNAPRVSFKRMTLFVNYTWTDVKNNSDGAFSPPPTGSLAAEWGTAPFEVPHRFNVTFQNQIVRNLLSQINFNTSSGNPYTIRTGLDENRDLIYDDRPAGVGRNTARGDGQWNLNVAGGYTLTFGRTTARLPPGIAVFNGGGGPQVQTFDQGSARFRLQFVVQVQNITNHANYVGYSGVLTSPFFGRPTAVLGTRKVDMGVQLSF